MTDQIKKIETLVKNLESFAWITEIKEYIDEPRKYVYFDELHGVQVSEMTKMVERFKTKTGINIITYVNKSEKRGERFTVKVF